MTADTKRGFGDATGLAVSAGLCLVAIGGMIGAARLGTWVDETPGPGLLPFGASAAMLVLVAARALVRQSFTGEEAPAELRRLLLYGLGLVLFAALFGPFGLPIAAAVGLLTVLVAAERMPLLPAFATVLAMVAGVLLLFDFALGVPLPWGPLQALKPWVS